MRLPLLFCLVVGSIAQICPPDWTLFNNFCYQYHHNRSATGSVNSIKQRCINEGAEPASGESVGEIAFLTSLAKADVAADRQTPSLGAWPVLYQIDKATITLGMTRIGETYNFQNVQGQQLANIPWCPGFGNTKLIDKCAIMYSRLNGLPSCVDDIECDDYNQWLFRYACKKRPCPSVGQAAFNGVCQCDKGYIEQSQRGQGGPNCVSANPCHQVTGSLSILFIIDSSASIGERNWDSLARFLKSGDHLLPKTARVGFIKYASNVSYAKWIEPGWTVTEFNRRVPFKYDQGETNTAEALKTALTMMRQDNNRNQVAVLITDGLPYTEEYKDNKDEALAITKQAARDLSRVVPLITMGYGIALHKENGETYLRQLVNNEREDYFKFQKDACDLQENHMSILLGKVCNRFVRR